MTHRLRSYLGYSYPGQLTELVKRAWPADLLTYLPNDWQLRLLLDVAYHASLLKEEQRPVTFRILLGQPDDIVKVDQPPTALSGISFDRPRPFNEQEVRRISMAADFFRSLVAVAPGRGEVELVRVRRAARCGDCARHRTDLSAGQRCGEPTSFRPCGQ